MEHLKNLGIRFSEHMGGFFTEGLSDPLEGFKKGRTEGHRVDFRVTIHIDPVVGFSKGREPAAAMEGRVSAGPLGQKLKIERGEFNIFPGREGSGLRHITYRFGFRSSAGEPHYFSGVKNIHVNRSEGSRSENVTLYSSIYRGDSEEGGLYGSGILLFNLVKDGPGLFLSIRATGARSFSERLMALRALRGM